MSDFPTSIFSNLTFRQPPAPEMVNEGKRLALQDNATVEDVARLISKDILFAVLILKRANNAYYGLSGNVNSLTHAVEILGVSSVLSMMITPDPSPRSNQPLSLITEHAFVTAQISHRLTHGHWIWANNAQSSIGGVFTAGLMHSIGRLAICLSYPEESKMLYGFSEDPFPVKGTFQEIEQLQFGADYSEIGAFIAVKYRLPSELIDVIRHSEDPHQLQESHPSYKLALTVNAASHMATSLGYGIDPQGSFLEMERSPGIRWIENQFPGLSSTVLSESHPFLATYGTSAKGTTEKFQDRHSIPHAGVTSRKGEKLEANYND